MFINCPPPPSVKLSFQNVVQIFILLKVRRTSQLLHQTSVFETCFLPILISLLPQKDRINVVHKTESVWYLLESYINVCLQKSMYVWYVILASFEIYFINYDPSETFTPLFHFLTSENAKTDSQIAIQLLLNPSGL